ncbi:MAG: metallophosphoesterase family protein [Candidatus Schekmanbacteria bacterium]|nr:metallophosphoesterase family protein [Candidatus Schekmanbacteria bacterium]
MRLIFFGDIHDRTSQLAGIPVPPAVDLAVLAGDITTGGARPQARRVLDAARACFSPVLAQVGNMDTADVDRYLTAEGVNLHRRAHLLGDGSVGICGVGGSNRTPFHTPTEFSEQELAEYLAEAHAPIRDAAIRIVVCHAPPRDTVADRLHSGAHVGSQAVRAFVVDTQPDLLVTGHIHEGVGADNIGRTVVINPGAFAHGGYVDVHVDGHSWQAALRIAGETAEPRWITAMRDERPSHQ